MIIELCPKGHRYDAAYFSECPHCRSASKASRTENTSGKTVKENTESKNSQKDSKRKSGFVQNISQSSRKDSASSDRIQQGIHEATEIITQTEKKATPQNTHQKKETNIQKTAIHRSNIDKSNIIEEKMILMASMPEKLIKSQEFCIDFCLFERSCWREGADMLSFKLKNGVRDIKTFSLAKDLSYTLRIFYKEDLLYTESLRMKDIKNQIRTVSVSIPDSRDRKIHPVRILLENADYDYKETLLLQANN